MRSREQAAGKLTRVPPEEAGALSEGTRCRPGPQTRIVDIVPAPVRPGRFLQPPGGRVPGLAIAAAVTLLGALAGPASAQDWRTVSKARQNRGADILELKVNYAVGRFALHAGPDRLLYRYNARYDEDIFKLSSNYLESDGQGTLSINLDGHDGIELKSFKDYERKAGELDIEVAPTTPLALNLKLGAVEADLDLGGLRIERLVLETGASETGVSFDEPNPGVARYCTFKAGAASFEVRGLGNSGCQEVSMSGGVGALTLDFSGEWKSDIRGSINVGLGSIEILVPPEVGVRIDRSTFLMAFDAPDFVKEDGGVWLSPNWDSADRRLNLTVSGALGGIKIARR